MLGLQQVLPNRLALVGRVLVKRSGGLHLPQVLCQTPKLPHFSHGPTQIYQRFREKIEGPRSRSDAGPQTNLRLEQKVQEIEEASQRQRRCCQ